MKKLIFCFLAILGIYRITFAVEDVIAEVIDIKFAEQVKNRKPINVSNVFSNDIKKNILLDKN